MKKSISLTSIIPLIGVFLLLFSVIIQVSCDDNKIEKQQIVDEETEQDLEKNESFPFEKIKSNSQRRKRLVDMDMLPKKLNPISKSFFRKWLGNTYVEKIEKKIKTLLSNKASYYFYDFAETDDLFLFSIISSVNSEQKELIHFTCDKKTGRINRADWIATNGGDISYSSHSKIEYSPDRLTLNITSEVTELVGRHWETHTKVSQLALQQLSARN